MSNTNSGGGGVGLLTVVGVVFIILKCTGVIAWSWVWVLAPFWMPLALAAFIWVLMAPLVFIAANKAKRAAEQRRKDFINRSF